MNGEALYRTTAKEEFLTEKKMLGEVSEVYEYEDSDIDLVVNCKNFIKYTEDAKNKFTLNIDTQLMYYKVKGYKYPKTAGSIVGYSIISFEEPLGEFENKDLGFFLENYPYEEYIDGPLQLVPEGVSNFVARIREKSE